MSISSGSIIRYLAILIAVLAPLLLPDTAHGHASLLRADPAPNSAVSEPPARVRLWFTEPLEARFSGIEVYDANRNRVDTGDFRVEESDGMSASIGLTDLPDGTYTVSWHNLSTVDGHSLAGAFAFSVGTAPPSGSVGGVTVQDRSESGVPVVPSALVRTLNFLAMAVLVGAFGFHNFVLPPARKGEPQPVAEYGAHTCGIHAAISSCILATTRYALGLLLAASIGSLILQAVIASRLPLTKAVGTPLLDLLSTRYGAIWLARLGLIIALAVLLWWPRTDWRRGWPWHVGLLLSSGVLLTTSLTSHSAASGQEELPQWLHVGRWAFAPCGASSGWSPCLGSLPQTRRVETVALARGGPASARGNVGFRPAGRPRLAAPAGDVALDR